MEIRLRYNTNDTNGENPWRLLIDGEENLVKRVNFEIPVSTTVDIIPEVGVKYHIGCEANEVEINEGVATIK